MHGTAPGGSDALNEAKYKFMNNALSSRTLSSYASGVKSFAIFCGLNNIDFTGGKWVGHEPTLVNYVCYLANIKCLAHATIKMYLAGLRNYCITHSLDYPFVKPNCQPMLQLKLVLKGIKKCRLPKPMLRLPITAIVIHKLFQTLNGQIFGSYIDSLMKAVIAMAYFGFLRCGEFTTMTNEFDPETNLCLGDLVINERQPNEIYVILKSSKTDPFRCGVSIPYFKLQSPICPVKALLDYSYKRSVFARDLMLPLFLFQDFTHLTRSKFLNMLHYACAVSGIDSSGYKGHSFRKGAATVCASVGVADHLIQSLGRWNSDCYKTYIHVSHASIQEAHRKMAREK